MHTRLRTLVLAAGIASATLVLAPIVRSDDSARAAPGAKAVAPRKWEHETSDLAPDSRFRFGALDNGMRFAWSPNATPKDRTIVRLHVRVGSLAETETECGMAHFLEHMAFNGSRHYPAGTLVSWFQGLGMDFGRDSNAHTSFDETVYELDLARSDAATIAEGLRVLRDFADGMLLTKTEIDAEKGVIDGEERERESAATRAEKTTFGKLFAGTRYAVRWPIGTKDVRDAFTPDSVRAFYRRWYRPENFTLVLVGDVGTQDVPAAIHAAFDDLVRPADAATSEPAIGTPDFAARTFVVAEHELPIERIELMAAKPFVARPFDSKQLLADLPVDLGRALLDHRLSEIARTGTAPFQSAGASRAEGLDAFDGESVDVVCEAGRWNEALTLAEHELRRALQFGFSDSELAIVKAEFRESLVRSVADAATSESDALAEGLLHAARERFVPTDPATIRDLFLPALEQATAKQVSTAFANAWKEGTRIVHAIGPLDLGKDADAQLAGALAESEKVAVKPREEQTTSKWAYAADRKRHGTIAKREKIENHGVEDVTFENGVRVLLKPTDVEKNEVHVQVNIGEGGLSLARDRYAIGFVANSVFAPGGLVAHDAQEIDRVLAGRSVNCGFAVEDDHSLLVGNTDRDDVELEFELLAAHVTAPGWRDAGFRAFERQRDEIFSGLSHRPEGPLLLDVLPDWFGGDARFGLPSEDAVAKITQDDVRAWLDPELASAPITIAVVGDFDLESAIDSASRTFGVLPKRRAKDAHDAARVASPMRAGANVEKSFDGVGVPALVFVAYPTCDGFTAESRRSILFLGRILNDRIRLKVREELGATYSPSARAQASRTYPGVGSIAIQAAAAPDQAQTVRDACVAVAADLAEHGVTAEEMDRLRGPLLAQIRDQQRDNGFWVRTLSELHERDDALADVDTAEAAYAALDAKQISALAARYLGKDHASTAIFRPRATGG